ncbi:MAG: T9SS type A sorting domain-containing protein, partial [Calditrichaeota bacterium]|nr:T9SS type A sorting domain-containing protein [Calditrichota bacterium]
LRELMQHYKSLTGIADDVPGNLPTTVALLGNYPNPFNPATTIVYALPEQATVELTVYNLLGESVTTLVKGTQSAGRHEVRWQPGELSSGIYLYQLQVGAQRYSGKMILMK